MKKVRAKPPEKHSQERKISIARQVIEEGKSQSELARETKISSSNIHKWVQQARRGEFADYVVPTFDEKTGDVMSER
jgi:transposase-like protein